MIQTDNNSLIGVAIGSISGIIIAIVDARKRAKSKDTVTIEKLQEELDELQTKISSLKTAFTLIFDEMERQGNLPDQLKDFKKAFEL
jgi:gas vesicle protein